MEFVRVIKEGPFRHPVLLVALDGWVNAGAAASLVGAQLVEDAEVVAQWSGDTLFDYRMSRPVVDFVDGVMDQVVWPELTVRHHPAAGRDLLVMTGIEPNWNWQSLADSTADLAGRWGVEEHVSIGAVPWAIPHTRPVSIMTTGSAPAGVSEDDRPSGLLRVPGAAVSVIEWAVSRTGIPSSGFWARVPNYVGATFSAAAIALLDRLDDHLHVELPKGGLEEAAAEERIQLDLAMSGRPEIKTMIEQLETAFDAQLGGVSGEDLATEIERFLREQ